MRKTIFVVDDSSIALIVSRKALLEHYNPITLPSATKMFELIKKVKPSLILLDLEMPEMNGFQALEKLKNDDEYSDIPVIFLTGTEDPVRQAEGLKRGAVDFILKPFDDVELVSRVKFHMDMAY
ncbi:MAG: response regulator [Defluviitaleaceae bacterium]|nr:response regulator [Defluviitaleaceae bacterium]